MFVDAFPETGIKNLFSAEVFKFNTSILSLMPFWSVNYWFSIHM